MGAARSTIDRPDGAYPYTTQERPTIPLHMQADAQDTNGDLTLQPGEAEITKIQVNGNVDYEAGPVTFMTLMYIDDTVEINIEDLIGPNASNVTIGYTVHLPTILGRPLYMRQANNARIVLRVVNSNTIVQLDIWGLKYV